MSKSNNSDHLIVTGDCDVDLFARSPERDTFMKYFSNRKFKQILSEVSTSYGSQLDCVFAKNFICSCDIYESFFSDHKPMLISLRTLVDDCCTMDYQLMIFLLPIVRVLVNMILFMLNEYLLDDTTEVN